MPIQHANPRSPQFPPIARLVALVARAATVALLAPAPALAAASPPPLRHDVGAFALYGRTSVSWAGAASMPLRTGVAAETSVEFSARTEAAGADSLVAGGLVTLRDSSHVRAVYASTLDAAAGVTLDFPSIALVPPVVAALDWPSPPAMACGGADVTVDSGNSPLALAPGRYGNVTVQQDQVLRLAAGGRYEFCSMRVRSGATVEAHAGTFVLLRDYLVTSARARLVGDGACGARWVALATTPSPAPASAGFEFGQGTGSSNRARIEGTFFTPGRIAMAQHNDYAGRFWADRIDGMAADQVTRTLADCSSAQCGDGIVDPGEACDDGNNRDGDCCTALCEAAPAGAACDDGRYCTARDACDAAGRCLGSGDPCAPPDGDGNCSEACNESTRACDGQDPDASACDDGLWCNGADQCAGGACAAHAGSPCPGPDGDANCREACQESSRSCIAPDPAGSPCNDGLFCTRDDACDAGGSCVGSGSPCPGADGDGDCSEGCSEATDACDAPDPVAAPCDDGLYCTTTDRCDGRGQCLGSGDPCSTFVGDGDFDCTEACDEGSASCTGPDPDGAPCVDALACTLDERCVAGACQGGSRTSCDDGNPCTDEFCAPDGSCLRSNNQSPCDDGNACTTADRCRAGQCTGTGMVDCRDDDLCSADVCDPADGSCHHAWAPASTCHQAGLGSTRFELGYSARDGQSAESLVTSWTGLRGVDPSTREEFGDPTKGGRMALCFYDESEGIPHLAYRLDFSPDTQAEGQWLRNWRPSGLTYRLKAPAGTMQGVSQVRLGVDKDGTATLRLKAGADPGCDETCRARFHPPVGGEDGRLFRMDPALTLQWVAEGGACWSSRYERAAENSALGFRAQSKAR